MEFWIEFTGKRTYVVTDFENRIVFSTILWKELQNWLRVTLYKNSSAEIHWINNNIKAVEDKTVFQKTIEVNPELLGEKTNG